MLPREDHPRSEKVGEEEGRRSRGEVKKWDGGRSQKKRHKSERKQKCRLDKKKGCGRGDELKGWGGKKKKEIEKV